MTAVKIRKRRPSKQRRMRRMTVAGGEKLLHSVEGRREEKDQQCNSQQEINIDSMQYSGYSW